MRDAVLDRIAAAWAEIAYVPSGLTPGKVTVAVSPDSRTCPPGWAGAICLGDGSVSSGSVSSGSVSGGSVSSGSRAAGALITVQTEDQATAVRDLLGTVDPRSVIDLATWGPLRPDGPWHILGPTDLAYLDPADFRPAANPLSLGADYGVVEALPRPELTDAIAALEEAAGPIESGEAGITEADSPLFVIRRDGLIASVCAYQPWVATFAHMMVLTHPDHRGRGLAKHTATAAAQHALDHGLIPQWRARVTASQIVARALGYTTIGAQLSLRLS